MHMAGPREALQHMIIRKNYGCTHFIIGRDMAGCKSSISGEDFYGPYQAQDFARENAPELGMETVPSLNLVYTEEEGYVTAEHADARGLHIRKLSGTQFRQMLRGGEEIPEWFAFKSVVEVAGLYVLLAVVVIAVGTAWALSTKAMIRATALSRPGRSTSSSRVACRFKEPAASS